MGKCEIIHTFKTYQLYYCGYYNEPQLTEII